MQLQTTRKHRSRTQPTPSGKRNALTENDLFGIFEPLSRYAQLTTKQLVAFDRRYATKTRNRLTDLYHEDGDWLVRLSEQIRVANQLFQRERWSCDEGLNDASGYPADAAANRPAFPRRPEPPTPVMAWRRRTALATSRWIAR